MKNLEELRKMDKIELQKKVNEYRKEAFNLRFQKSSGQLENVSRISTTNANPFSNNIHPNNCQN